MHCVGVCVQEPSLPGRPSKRRRGRIRENFNKQQSLASSGVTIGSLFLLLWTCFIHFQQQTEWNWMLKWETDVRSSAHPHLCLCVRVTRRPEHILQKKNWVTPISFVWLWNQEITGETTNVGAQGENLNNYQQRLFVDSHSHTWYLACFSEFN